VTSISPFPVIVRYSLPFGEKWVTAAIFFIVACSEGRRAAEDQVRAFCPLTFTSTCSLPLFFPPPFPRHCWPKTVFPSLLVPARFSLNECHCLVSSICSILGSHFRPLPLLPARSFFKNGIEQAIYRTFALTLFGFELLPLKAKFPPESGGFPVITVTF